MILLVAKHNGDDGALDGIAGRLTEPLLYPVKLNAGTFAAIASQYTDLATVVCASVPVATLIAAVEATGKRCRVEGEQRSFTIVRSGKPTQDSDAALLLTQPPDACCR